MYAIVAESADRLLWQEVGDVAAGPGEVLVKVSAAGVNRADLLQAAGLYPPPPGASELLGMEVSGVIEAVGEGVDDWSPGKRSVPCWRAAAMPNTSQSRPGSCCRIPPASTSPIPPVFRR